MVAEVPEIAAAGDGTLGPVGQHDGVLGSIGAIAIVGTLDQQVELGGREARDREVIVDIEVDDRFELGRE